MHMSGSPPRRTTASRQAFQLSGLEHRMLPCAMSQETAGCCHAFALESCPNLFRDSCLQPRALDGRGPSTLLPRSHRIRHFSRVACVQRHSWQGSDCWLRRRRSQTHNPPGLGVIPCEACPGFSDTNPSVAPLCKSTCRPCIVGASARLRTAWRIS